MPIVCRLFVSESGPNKWKKLRDFDVSSDSGPLTPLGLPLIRPNDEAIKKLLSSKDMDLELEFSGFPRAPALLWDAATIAKDGKP